MPEAAIFLLISLLLFLLITDTVTVKFIYADEKRIDIDLTIFGMSFTDRGFSENRFSKKRRRREKIVFDHVLRLLSKSTVRIKELSVLIDGSDPMKYALTRSAYHSFISVFILYIEQNSKFFSADDIIVGASDNNKTVFKADLRAQISLWDFSICLISYLFSKRKNENAEEKYV